MSGIIAQNSGRHTGLVKASSGGGGVWNLIKTYTASTSADLSFVEGTDGIDFTAYDEFVFKFYDIHPSDNGIDIKFNGSSDGGSNYNVTKTTTDFLVYHNEADNNAQIVYNDGHDIAQGTGFQQLSQDIGNDNDQSAAGTLHIFNPSSDTFVKHYILKFNNYHDSDYSMGNFGAGYFNTTSAIDAIQFKMSAGTIDAGQISLYGIS
jgi:hypothetical protein